MEHSRHRDGSQADESPAHPTYKKPYVSPRLIVHGKIEEITKNGGGGGTDGVFGSD
jgi:hypothetical protein